MNAAYVACLAPAAMAASKAVGRDAARFMNFDITFDSVTNGCSLRLQRCSG
jgi:hypothetical protein